MIGKLRHLKVCLVQDGTLTRMIQLGGCGLYQASLFVSPHRTLLRKMTLLKTVECGRPTDPQIMIHTTAYHRLMGLPYPEWLTADHLRYHTDTVLLLDNGRWGVGFQLDGSYLLPARLMSGTALPSTLASTKNYPRELSYKTATQAYRAAKSFGWEWKKAYELKVVHKEVRKVVPLSESI